MRTIGLDVHKRFAEVTVLELGKGIQRRPRLQTTPTALRAFAQTLGPEDHVALEASANTWAIADLLRAHAGRVVVSNPMRTQAIASAKVKTDRVDSAILAQLLAADFLPPVWIPDSATQALRRQVAHRQTLVQQTTRLRNRIHAILHRNLVEHPFTDLFGKAGRRWLATVPLPRDERCQLESALRLLHALETEIRLIDSSLAHAALNDERVLRLMTIPGVGFITAISIVAVIGDIRRFSHAAKLVGYLGLDPRVRQSGDRPAHIGHISRQGQAHARGLLVEAAHSAIRVPGPLRAFYQRVRNRRGPQIAIVAVARKLVVLAWHLLTHYTDYRWTPPSLTAHKRRRLELQAGAPTLRGRSGRTREIASQKLHEHERKVLEQAEEAYQAWVAARMGPNPEGGS